MFVIAGGILLALLILVALGAIASIIPTWFTPAWFGFFAAFFLSFTEKGMAISAQVGTNADDYTNGHVIVGAIGGAVAVALYLLLKRPTTRVHFPVR